MRRSVICLAVAHLITYLNYNTLKSLFLKNMFRKLLFLSLFVGYIFSFSTIDQYIQKQMPIETFEPFTEKYDTISSRQCSQVCNSYFECQAFQFQNSVCVGSLIMSVCTLFKQVKSNLIPNVLSGSVISVYWKVDFEPIQCKKKRLFFRVIKFLRIFEFCN